MNDLVYLSYFLGLQVSCNVVGYYLSQVIYVINHLSCVDLWDNKIVSTLLETNVKLSLMNEAILENYALYR